MRKSNIRGVSFDLWGTLIKSHPLYKEKRIKLIADFIAYRFDLNLTEAYVGATLRYFERVLDSYSEASGKQIACDDSFLTMFNMCGIRTAHHSDALLLRKGLRDLLLELPPQMIESAAEVLFELRDRNIKIGICSNTNLITGKELVHTFRTHDMCLLDVFGKCLTFSDQEGMSKPNNELFMRAFARMATPIRHILHVGDNPHTDGGANEVGSALLLVNNELSPWKIGDIIHYLDGKEPNTNGNPVQTQDTIKGSHTLQS